MGALLELRNVRQSFTRPDGRELNVLEGVNLTLGAGEIVGMLGKSGSGKSTLLRLVAGLVRPTQGDIVYHDGATPNISMVFQTFALFPWLTVLQNVELGLEAIGTPAQEMRKRALDAIDLIGLDGYESAYPRELSGGMKQRVGFARALVVNPDILLMDEAFSALDVLTAETLKTDLVELWVEKRMSLKSILMVTHNIEEAVLMCDRIVVVSSNPGTIASEFKVDITHPRDRQSPKFVALVEQIYRMMTTGVRQRGVGMNMKSSELNMHDALPRVSPNQIAGLLEELSMSPYNGHADIPDLDQDLGVGTEEVLHLVEALRLLKFANVAEGDITVNAAGNAFVEADTQERKEIFAQQLITNIPLAAYVLRVLQSRPRNTAPRIRFLTQLEDLMAEEDALEALSAVTSWGRYAEVFAYDDNTEMYSLEDPTA